MNIRWEGLASVNKKTELSCNSKHARACYKQEDRKQKEGAQLDAPIFRPGAKFLYSGILAWSVIGRATNGFPQVRAASSHSKHS